MFDLRSTDRRGATRDEETRAAPGRSTRVQAEYDDDPVAAEPMFPGEASWEDIDPDEGEHMLRDLAPSPGPDDTSEGSAGPDALDGAAEGSDHAPGASDDGDDLEAPAAEAAADNDELAPANAPIGGGSSSKSAAGPGKVPGSPYATSHRKEMRNYRFKPGTRITNTVPGDEGGTFGPPNTYHPEAVLDRYRDFLLRTVSVDIGTVVGGKPPRYLDGWVLVFHKYVPKGKRKFGKLDTGDHTGWIRVRQLASSAIKSLSAYQDKVRRTLTSGKGSGHAAQVTGGPRKLHPVNHDIIANPRSARYFAFTVLGGSDDTNLGNYTLRPERYGNVIVGVWNPPGSGAGGQRFGGSGGIRAFLPLETRFLLARTAPIEIADRSGQATSTWHYVRARVNNERIFCWVLQSWRTPEGSGSNF